MKARKLLVRMAEKGDLEMVRTLVEESGVDIHYDNELALRVSAENGHLEVVKYLVERGADIDAREDEALFKSLKNGHFEIVEYLIGQRWEP